MAGRWVVGIAGVCLLATLAAQTKLLAFDRPADENNPYAYAHTGEDLLGLPTRLEQLAGEHHLAHPRIAVIAADAWPLPWYLRKFSDVGYWQPGQDAGPADFFITTTDVSGPLAARLKDFRPEFFGVRPGVLIVLWTPPALKPEIRNPKEARNPNPEMSQPPLWKNAREISRKSAYSVFGLRISNFGFQVESAP